MDMDVVNKTVEVLNHYPGPYLIATSIICSGVMAWAVLRWKESQDWKKLDNDMKRRAMLDQLYADDFGDVLFNRLMSGDINRHEYRRDCKRFGIAYRLGDLLTKKNPKRGLGYRVRKNCEDMHRSPSAAGKIPGDKHNGIPAVVVVVKRKVWQVEGKALPRLKSVS
jgi:hypothetical protein